MKSAIAALASVLFFSSPGFAAVENVLSMQREATGTFSVLCDTQGVVSHHAGVAADTIRNNAVCGEQVHIALLEEGLYRTNGDFCFQTVKWDGEKLQLLLEAPCSGIVVLEKFQEGWYRGSMQGFDYIYEVEVKSMTSYIFYSRSFNTQAEFVKPVKGWKPNHKAKAKRHHDPVRN